MKKIIKKLLSILRVRSAAAGLEVSDQVVRLVFYDGKVWQMHALRLEPGILDNGRIRNREELIAAFTALKAKAGKGQSKKKASVVLCLSSVAAYTQVFPLPMVEGENLENAVALNLQMLSPLEAGEAYSGWQLVGRDEKTLRLEILAAFMEKKIVDEMVDALFEAGFLVTAAESKALALTRVLREKGAGVDPARPYLFVSVDNSGVDFLIIRHGSLYFEYSTSWKDLTDEKGNIPIERFEAALSTSLRQVVNFYNQHWSDPLSALIISAVALAEQTEKVVAENSPVPGVRLTLIMGQPISSEWLIALGCSLRGMELSTKDGEVNLLGENSQDRFHDEQLLSFIRFWRTLVPIALGFLILTFVVADAFIHSTRTTVDARTNFSTGGNHASEIAALQAQANDFNQLVALAASAEEMIHPKNAALGTILAKASEFGVVVDHLAFSSPGSPIPMSGHAASEDRVKAFKAALQADQQFGSVNLPLTGIQTNGSIVTFSVSFTFTPAAPAPPK